MSLSDRKVRLGVVGLGHRGRAMMKLAAQFDCAEMVAACDIRPRNWHETQWNETEPFSQQFPKAEFYEDYDQMLERANLDAVIVETGADIHAEFCCKALRRDVNVLSDIPNVASLGEAGNLWKTAQDSRAMIVTGANPNEQKFAVLLRDFYEKGLLGRPYCMDAEYIHWWLPGSPEAIHLNENGDWRKMLIPIRYCTHSLGPLLSILTEELRQVSCFGTGRLTDDENFQSDDMMCAQFKTDSGVIVRLMRNGRCRAELGLHSYRVFGTEGYMERIDRMGKPVIRYNSTRELDTSMKEIGGEFMPPAYANNPKATGHGGIDYAMMDHFMQTLVEGKPPYVDLSAGLRMTLPGIYAEESARRGGKVLRMRYPWDSDWTTEIEP